MKFGIDFAFNLAPALHKNPSCWLNDFGDRILIDFDPKYDPNLSKFMSLFHNFFDPSPHVMFWEVPWLTLAPF